MRRLSPVWCAAAVVVAGALVQAFVLAAGDVPLRTAVIDLVDVAVLVVAGAVLWRRAPTGTGPLLVLTGVPMAINNLVYVDGAPVLRVVGMVVTPVFTPALAAALLAFPGGRLRRVDRTVVAGALLLTTVLWWGVLATYAEPPGCTSCPSGDPLPGVGDRALFDVLVVVLHAMCGGVGLYVAVQLVRRWRRSSPAARRVRAPVMVAGALTCVAVGVAAPFGVEVLDGVPPNPIVTIAWGIGFAAIPLAVLGAVLRQRTARVPLPELLRALDGASAGPGLRDALAAALGDPTLEVVHRVPGRAGWEAGAGRPADLAGGGRVVTPLGGPGARTAMLHDAALLEDHALLETVARAAALALEHDAMRRRLREQLEEARAVRARIVQASDDTRRTIERDLHDGAQQTLVSLALALSMLDEELAESGDELALRLVRHAAEQADRALEELRDLARGVFPALLVNDGLDAGLRELARRCPLPVALELDLPERPDPAVEAAGWFLVREALANAVAHAGARRVTVRAVIADGTLELEVADDGAGGALRVPGGGLVQLADRVAALGGTLELTAAAGGGTRLAATLPAEARRPARPAASAPTAVPSG